VIAFPCFDQFVYRHIFPVIYKSSAQPVTWIGVATLLVMHLPVGNPPVFDPRRPFLTFGTSPFVHVSSICSIHIATNGTLGLVRILSMIGPRNAAMTAVLLAVGIQVADFYGLAATFLPFNLYIDVVHIDLLSQQRTERRAFAPHKAAEFTLGRSSDGLTPTLIFHILKDFFEFPFHSVGPFIILQ